MYCPRSETERGHEEQSQSAKEGLKSEPRKWGHPATCVAQHGEQGSRTESEFSMRYRDTDTVTTLASCVFAEHATTT